jgi:hypothetical protein
MSSPTLISECPDAYAGGDRSDCRPCRLRACTGRSRTSRSEGGLQAKVTGIVEYGPTVNPAIKTDKLPRDKAAKHDPVAMEVSSMTFM